ncbi:hypothetical protein BaRGS_00031897, partial [Batillaria attramentaria]
MPMDQRSSLLLWTHLVFAAATGIEFDGENFYYYFDITFVCFSKSGISSTCEAPAVPRGQSTNVTCLFNRDISHTKEDVTVLKYDNDHKYTVVLDFKWPSSEGTEPRCFVHPGYSFDGHISRTLVLGVPSASDQHVGTYECQIIPADKKIIPEAANDSGLEETTGQNQKNGSNEIQREESNESFLVPVLLPVFLCIVMVGTICVILIIRRRRHKASKKGKDDEQDIFIKQGKVIYRNRRQQGVGSEEISVIDCDARSEEDPATSGVTQPFITNADTTEQQMLDDMRDLFAACETGDVDTVNKTVSSYRNMVHFTNSNGETALHVASKYGQVHIVEKLLGYGASVDAKDNSGLAPLHTAVCLGAATVGGALLESVEATDGSDNKPPHTATIGTDAKDNTDNTPLQSVDYSQTTEVVGLLLRHGAKVNAKDNKDRTPLHIASCIGATEVADLLLKKGAIVNAQDASDNTPLHTASYFGAADATDLLLKYRADTDCTNKKKSTALHLACSDGKLTANDFREAVGDITESTDRKLTALVINKHESVVEKLLDAGASVSPVDVKGRTPLHLACLNRKQNIVDTLINTCSSVDPSTYLTVPMGLEASDSEGRTPLHMACYGGSEEV